MKILCKAIFIERDGVLNEVEVSSGHQVAPTSSRSFKLKTESTTPILELKRKGYLVIVTTNQPGLSDGSLPRSEVLKMHADLRNTFSWINDIFVCPHTYEDGCYCRKPQDGLFKEAASKWNIDLPHSFIISDKHPDHTIAKKIGARSYQIKSLWNPKSSGFILVPDLPTALNLILRQITEGNMSKSDTRSLLRT